jgi:hypothetical protein
MNSVTDHSIIEAKALHAYFHDAIHEAADEKKVDADQATLHYLALLLSNTARSEQLFDYSDSRLQLRPLALIYGDALAASNRREKRLWLQRLGDLALIIGGLFAGRLSRHFTDLDYCVAMGGNAYGYLEQTAERGNDQALVFGQLAAEFEGFVGVVAEVTGRPAHSGRFDG